MSITLQPKENFVIVRTIQDPGDSTTYYVKAVVRNSKTDAIIDTVYLEDKGNRRFTKLYQVPMDVSGLGMFIDITTSVYTDSNYTTYSTTYGEENETYLIFDRFARIGGGGGGADVDYPKIKKLITEGLGSIKPVTVTPTDLTPILKRLDTIDKCVNEIEKSVNEMEMPEGEKVDLTPVLNAIETAKQSVLGAIPEPFDLSSIEGNLNLLASEERVEEMENSKESFSLLREELADVLKQVPELEKLVDKISRELQQIFMYQLALTNPNIKPIETMKDRVKALTNEN